MWIPAYSSAQKSTSVFTSEAFEEKKIKLQISHARMGHTSVSKMKHLSVFDDFDLDNMFCETCRIAKHHRLPFQRSESIAQHLFDIVHIDLWGPYKVSSISGAKILLNCLR